MVLCKIPKKFLPKFLTGLQQDKKLVPPLAGVFSMTGHSLPICRSRVQLTVTRTHDLPADGGRVG